MRGESLGVRDESLEIMLAKFARENTILTTQKHNV